MDTLDQYDRHILSLMQQDGRISLAKLAERIGLSETPCVRRLKRLESDGYINSYHAVLSRKALALGVLAFALVHFGEHDRTLYDRFEHEIQGIERIVACHSVAGSADYLLQIVAKDMDDYGHFVHDVLRVLPGVAAVDSMLAMGEIKPFGGLPLL
ncbi:Lrp/AsnC family transcriptional regulator [Silvimonas amylolytica]|uniref:AsnC family transcriptional regulator n=1 Tax=Silvimonas amylolytica TaxID=449663 RepID=A0ABQ2PIS0_9NEIS|nr:Lrp/AsnC family transcriptional regulator [Silvimonas amylolytica]GGP25125.1 AsnC family transcriptional regulator [Silvimonas amylolytica]